MAIVSLPLSPKILLQLFLISRCLLLPSDVNAVPEHEVEAMLATLRSRNSYALFANAIDTSDLRHELLAANYFTFFAPPDSTLFALDMTAPASSYILALRSHAIARRLSLADLRTLPDGSSISPSHDIRLSRRRSQGSELISINGVDIIAPGLFYGSHIAVHGLAGIISSPSPANVDHRSRGENSIHSRNYTGLLSQDVTEEAEGEIRSDLAIPPFDLTLNGNLFPAELSKTTTTTPPSPSPEYEIGDEEITRYGNSKFSFLAETDLSGRVEDWNSDGYRSMEPPLSDDRQLEELYPFL